MVILGNVFVKYISPFDFFFLSYAFFWQAATCSAEDTVSPSSLARCQSYS